MLIANQYLAAVPVGVIDAFGKGSWIEVETGEVAGVGVVLEAHVDAIRSMIDGGFQRRQVPGRADQVQANSADSNTRDSEPAIADGAPTIAESP